MRSFFFAAASLCSLTTAFPNPFKILAPWDTMAPPPAGTQLYQLQTKSTTTTVSGQWLALATGSTQYSLATAQTAATKFFTNKYDATGTYAFHNADDTRQVALQGTNGTLLYVVDVTNPSSGTIPAGQLLEWATFTTDSNVLGVKDGSTLTNRTFVAVQGTGNAYTVALYDGASNTTAKITPITLNIVKV
ncbi:hypothetical protein K491DRAFT_766703 [Lophiostoma macrostomum CBS 122681]|uniref:Uncharacterized protein n=1 Tax=Lophiostoma macrostomum CBS 122681 TaxID=1314788 RepID=A0A6A6TG84_9PLEO|nr:hypothetical protein K491DRAFT_766703 [Lophiostoma macrostomum CBS 122681]